MARRPRASPSRRWLLLPACAAVLALALAPASASSATTTEADERPTVTCDTGPGRDGQAVDCRVQGLPEGTSVRLDLVLDEPVDGRRTFVSGARVADDGRARAGVALPCGVGAAGEVLVDARTDGQQVHEHRQDVAFDGSCPDAFDRSLAWWLVAALGVVGVGGGVVALRRRRRRSSRRRLRRRSRSHAPGPRSRRRGRWRRRSRGRRRRRRSSR